MSYKDTQFKSATSNVQEAKQLLKSAESLLEQAGALDKSCPFLHWQSDQLDSAILNLKRVIRSLTVIGD